jgi:hypothetical protein
MRKHGLEHLLPTKVVVGGRSDASQSPQEPAPPGPTDIPELS